MCFDLVLKYYFLQTLFRLFCVSVPDLAFLIFHFLTYFWVYRTKYMQEGYLPSLIPTSMNPILFSISDSLGIVCFTLVTFYLLFIYLFFNFIIIIIILKFKKTKHGILLLQTLVLISTEHRWYIFRTIHFVNVTL